MPSLIAIHPDHHRAKQGPQSFSDRWFRLLTEMGVRTREVNVLSSDLPGGLEGIAAFMWRSVSPLHFAAARRIIPAIEAGMRIPTYPSSRAAQLAQDKIAQSYLLQLANLPHPTTRVCFDAETALNHLASATYPLVIKLASGQGSQGVALATDVVVARRYVDTMFGPGFEWLSQLERPLPHRLLQRARNATKELLGGEVRERHRAYVYFQEYVGDNAFDIRVTIIGRYATAFRRFNRPGDFRASGSGRIDWDPGAIPRSAVELAFEVSRKLELPFVAVDVLFDGEQPLVCELNFSYLAWAVDQCAGYWVCDDLDSIAVFSWQDAKVDCASLTLREFLRLNALCEKA